MPGLVYERDSLMRVRWEIHKSRHVSPSSSPPASAANPGRFINARHAAFLSNNPMIISPAADRLLQALPSGNNGN